MMLPVRFKHVIMSDWGPWALCSLWQDQTGVFVKKKTKKNPGLSGCGVWDETFYA